jgi:hypothetical protein
LHFLQSCTVALTIQFVVGKAKRLAVMAESDSTGLDLLDEDIMGELLPLLTVDDIKSARLCCKGWHRSIQHRTRTLSAFYLPLAAPQHPLSSLEVVQLPLIRPVQQHLLPPPPRLQASHNTQVIAADIATTTRAAAPAARNPQGFTSLAPLRGLSAAGVQGLSHASMVNLTGQQLPYNVLKLLSQHMTRLKSLQLDHCRLPAPALLHATGLTTLQSLSLAGIRLQAGFHLHVKEAIAAATAAAEVGAAHVGAAAAAVVSAAAAAADYVVWQAGPAQQRPASTTTSAAGAASSRFAAAWVTEQQSTVSSSWLHPPAACSLAGWASSRLAGITAADYGVLLDAVLLPQLQQLILDVPAKPLVSFWWYLHQLRQFLTQIIHRR